MLSSVQKCNLINGNGPIYFVAWTDGFTTMRTHKLVYQSFLAKMSMVRLAHVVRRAF